MWHMGKMGVSERIKSTLVRLRHGRNKRRLTGKLSPSLVISVSTFDRRRGAGRLHPRGRRMRPSLTARCDAEPLKAVECPTKTRVALPTRPRKQCTPAAVTDATSRSPPSSASKPPPSSTSSSASASTSTTRTTSFRSHCRGVSLVLRPPSGAPSGAPAGAPSGAPSSAPSSRP